MKHEGRENGGAGTNALVPTPTVSAEKPNMSPRCEGMRIWDTLAIHEGHVTRLDLLLDSCYSLGTQCDIMSPVVHLRPAASR